MRGDRLARLREERGLTQVELSSELNIGENQIWRYENGTKPRNEILTKIAEFFNVSTDYLLGIVDYPSAYIEGELTPREREVIAAWRRGDRFEAIKGIVEDE